MAIQDGRAALHPIVSAVTERLRPAQNEPYGLLPQDLLAVRGVIAAYLDKSEIVAAVEALTVFAAFLQVEKSSPGVAKELIEIALSALPALRAHTTQRVQRTLELVENAARSMSAFHGKYVAIAMPRGSGLPEG